MNSNTIEGVFTYTLYKSNNYMVSSFLCDEGKITVTGPSVEWKKNDKYILSGDYVEHPKYGFQFSYIKFEKLLPKKDKEIISFLSSDTFEGIGKKTAQKIFEVYGENVLEILKENPQLIQDLDLTKKQKDAIIIGFESLNDPKNETIFKLIEGGFTFDDASLIYDKYKTKTNDILNNNPYKFYLDIYGISFNKIIEFTKDREFESKRVKFIEAYLVYLVKEMTFQKGDTYVLYEELENVYLKNIQDGFFDESLNLGIKDHYLIQEENRIYIFNEYYDEILIGKYLNNIKSDLKVEKEQIRDALKNLSNIYSIKYDEKQIEAIKKFFNFDVSIITGGPGTGKTTIVKSLVSIFKEYLPFNNIIVVAPTGRAAKRISEICDVESKTIHSLLKWNKETNTFAFDNDNPLLYDAIIIDEFSMVDNFLFASLLRASENVSKICLIGDDNQLPSIRQGNLLEDIIDKNIFPITRLKDNHRQTKGSEIIQLVNDIKNNKVNIDKYKTDVHFIENNDSNKLISLIDNDIFNGYDFNDIQVLAPVYKGALGIDNLNSILQNYFNPESSEKTEKVIGNRLFRLHDKILQLKNRPLDDVYNGDIGELIEINEKEKYFLIDFSNTLVYYNFDDLQDISLAYCMSVHKAQGSEYKIVYVVLSSLSKYMLSKKLLYTALSRAKEKLVILGNRELFLYGISKISEKRKTTLKERLDEQKEN